ncbi:hypothetical protein SARC_16948, partial [Sphaeroforma arctica JP610]
RGNVTEMEPDLQQTVVQLLLPAGHGWALEGMEHNGCRHTAAGVCNHTKRRSSRERAHVKRETGASKEPKRKRAGGG